MEQLSLMDDLKQDHERLCGELDVLRSAENDDGVLLRQTLRDVCARLSLGLLEHIRREERLLTTHGRSLGAAASEIMVQPLINHYGDYRYLQVITRHITLENRPFLLTGRYQLLESFILELQRHMDKQEEDYFPIVGRILARKVEEPAWN